MSNSPPGLKDQSDGKVVLLTRFFWLALLILISMLYKVQAADSQTLREQQAKTKLDTQRAERQARVEALKLKGINSLPDMVKIPAGQFQMGSNDDHYGRDREGPEHTAYVSAFMLATTETTQALWHEVMGENPAGFKATTQPPEHSLWYEVKRYWQEVRGGNPDTYNRPVESVSWVQVNEFIDILNRATGRAYRLPTETEWEYAARAGTTTRYHWGDRPDTNKANYNIRHVGTKNVKSYAPNNWGLFNMHGNVSEWVQDCSMESYARPQLRESEHPCYFRVIRGGSWDSSAFRMGVTHRGREDGSNSKSDIGFRLASDD